MSLDHMTLQAVFGNGRVAALGTVMQMFSCMCSYMHVVVHLVPEKLTYEKRKKSCLESKEGNCSYKGLKKEAACYVRLPQYSHSRSP